MGLKVGYLLVSVNDHRATGSNEFVPGRTCTRTMQEIANPLIPGKSSLPLKSGNALSPSTPDHHQGGAQRKSGCFSVQLIVTYATTNQNTNYIL